MSPDTTEASGTRKPADSAFKQQRLPAWQPILTAGTVLPAFFVIGIAFIPVGVGLLYLSDEVKEFVIDYTTCNKTVGYLGNWQATDESCQSIIHDNPSESCTCRLNFVLPKDYPQKVYMYYGLSNFYQNHRRYVKSRDDYQLLGRLDAEPSRDCEPFAYANESKDVQKPIAPCGAIANSMFNDKLSLVMWDKSNNFIEVPLLRTGIAWESDKKIKFKNPVGSLKKAFENFSKPTAWKQNIWELDLEENSNNGFQNEDFIVWMRTAALPTFRKLYRRIDHSQIHFKNGLKKGNYTLTVDYNYDVSSFDGSKRMILSTTSLLGGKNPFLGIAYIVVGCICLLLGIALLFIHIKCGKGTSEMINVNPTTSYNVNPSTSYQ